MLKRVMRKCLAAVPVLLCLLLLLTTAAGCSKAEPAGAGSTQGGGTGLTLVEEQQPETEAPAEAQTAEVQETAQQGAAETEAAGEVESEPAAEEPETGHEPGDAVEPAAEPELPQIDEDGSYTTKEDVALYLHVYGKLPSNFITKKEARALGWDGGSLEDYAPGKCIGGDYYGNYEGNLPDGDYHECDIGTLGKKKRGAKRLVYSDDGRIYYTGDHYKTFELLYGEESGEE